MKRGNFSVDADFFIELRPQTTANLPIPQQELLILSRHFRHFRFPLALEILFYFYYGTRVQKRKALSHFREKRQKELFVDTEEYFNLDDILQYTDEQFKLLANELLYQYSANHPHFLDIYSIKKLPNCDVELSAIEEKMAEHPVLLFRVVERCVKLHTNEALVSKCVLLLLSKNSASQADALAKLGFDFEYRILLKAFVTDIANLLFAMHKDYARREKLLTTQDVSSVKLIDFLKQLKSIQQIEPFDEIDFYEKKVIYFINRGTKFTSHAKHQALLENLGKSTLDWVTTKLRLNELGNELTQSNSEFSGQKNNGILFAAVTNVSLASKILEAEQNCNKARTAYNSVLKDLEDFLELHP